MIMTDTDTLIALAASKTKTKKAAKSLALNELKKLIDNLSAAYSDEKKREAAKEEKKKAAALKKLQAMMAESGLTPAEVAKLAGAAPKKRGRKPKAKAKTVSKVPPKYKITANGETHKWTGRGRMPVIFREYVEGGGSLESCLIS
jgi:DNA-binding protein H-NS